MSTLKTIAAVVLGLWLLSWVIGPLLGLVGTLLHWVIIIAIVLFVIDLLKGRRVV